MKLQADMCAAVRHWLVRAAITCVVFAACPPPAPAQTAGTTAPTDADKVLAGQLALGKVPEIDSKFIIRLLTGQIVPVSSWPVSGVEVSHTVIKGDLNLTGAHVAGRVTIRDSTFLGLTNLRDVVFDQSLTLECDTFKGEFQALSLHVGGNFSLQADHFERQVFLYGAQTGGFLWAGASSFDNGFDLGNAHIGRTFSMNAVDQKKFCGGSGIPNGSGETAPHGLSLESAQIDGDLGLKGHFGHTGNQAAINAHAVRVKGLVQLEVKADGDIDLNQSSIGGTLVMNGLSLTGSFNAVGSRIADEVRFSGSFGQAIDFSSANLGRDFKPLILPPAETGTDCRIRMKLQNAHISHLSDELRTGDGICHDIAGLTYDSLNPPDQSPKEAKNWRVWLAEDDSEKSAFDPQPYRQLATVFSLLGNKDQATDVAYWAREQERDKAWQQGQLGTYAGLTFLNATVGYGIGSHIFNALIWAILIMLLGAYVLGLSEPARQRGMLWRLQASLDRLLPVVELSPEFDEFFRNPNIHQLKPWQVLFFSGVSISGWVLGAFLAAALSGLTQGSS